MRKSAPSDPPAPGLDDEPGGNPTKTFWPSFAGVKAAIGTLAEEVETLGESAVEKTRQAGHAVGLAAAKAAKATRQAGRSALHAAVDATRPATASRAGQAALWKAGETAKPVIETSRKAVDTFNETVDPAAVGGAVAGMAAGEAVGAVIGGVLGSLAGPAGTVLGAEAGAFAGATIGAKMGYDVTHEVVHPDQADADKSFKERLADLPEALSRKAGENTGGKAGAAGGAAIGAVMAGPVGAMVGSAMGEAIAGELGEGGALGLYRKAKKFKAKKSAAEPSPAAVEAGNAQARLAQSARNVVGETGTEAALAALGGMVAGPAGERVGQRIGAVTALHMDWSLKGRAAPIDKPDEPEVPDRDGAKADSQNREAILMNEIELRGMTVNERLVTLGLITEFDRAAYARDRRALIAILVKARFTEEQARQTTGALLANPERYGF